MELSDALSLIHREQVSHPSNRCKKRARFVSLILISRYVEPCYLLDPLYYDARRTKLFFRVS